MFKWFWTIFLLGAPADEEHTPTLNVVDTLRSEFAVYNDIDDFSLLTFQLNSSF